MFSFIRAIRRKRLAREPFPPAWLSVLKRKVPFFEEIPPEDRERFLGLLRLFVAEKRFSGAGGLEVTDEMKVVIASAAALLVLNLGIEYLDRLSEVIVYPEPFYNPDADEERSGETHEWGVVLVAWSDVKEDFEYWGDGMNTAIHEFAHVLDRAAGAFDGTPELHALEHYRRWVKVTSRHFLRLRKGGRPETRVLDEYGAESEAEFFAVATESFFGIPAKMRRHTPDLYRELSRFYRADPLEWRGPRKGKASR